MTQPVSMCTATPAPARTLHTSIPHASTPKQHPAHFFCCALRISALISSRFFFARRCVPSCACRRNGSAALIFVQESGSHSLPASTAAFLVYANETTQQRLHAGTRAHLTQRWWQGRRLTRQDVKDSLRTFFLHSLRARLSLPTFSSSVTRFSYGARPATSRMISRTNFTRLLARCTPPAPRFQREAAATLIAPEHARAPHPLSTAGDTEEPTRVQQSCCSQECCTPQHVRLSAASRSDARCMPLALFQKHRRLLRRGAAPLCGALAGRPWLAWSPHGLCSARQRCRWLPAGPPSSASC